MTLAGYTKNVYKLDTLKIDPNFEHNEVSCLGDEFCQSPEAKAILIASMPLICSMLGV